MRRLLARSHVSPQRRRPHVYLACVSVHRYATVAASTVTPSNVQHRLQVWNELWDKHQCKLSHREHQRDVQVRLVGQSDVMLVSAPVATSATVFEQMEIKDMLIGSIVNGQLWDLHRPFEEDENVIEPVFWSPDDHNARQLLWHSGAHVLGWALESVWGDRVSLSDGPATEDGFFYDFTLRSNDSVDTDQLKVLEKRMKKLSRKKQRFQRLTVTGDEAHALFRHNVHKRHMLHTLAQNTHTNVPLTVYRCGDFVDLCRGPHVPHTGFLKACQLLQASATTEQAYVQQQQGEHEQQQQEEEQHLRVYGIAYPSIDELNDWGERRAEAERRDHRVIGRDQKLFMFHQVSPGSAFFLPNGTHVYRCLERMIRREYVARGFHEVITPQVYDKSLWETSGHWEQYQEDMFIVRPFHEHNCGDQQQSTTSSSPSPTPSSSSTTTTSTTTPPLHHPHVHHEHGVIARETLGLKPMNCPGHCLMFDHEVHSYRELPIRYADFGVLHRNELSGALSGLTRVRKFCQDDAHIFCRSDQLQDEIAACLSFVHDVYARLGFTYTLTLSTKPLVGAIGSHEQWTNAETALKHALKRHCGDQWATSEGDGAFYGPKIDVHLKDALQRSHQCGTIQLDFQLPQRFKLSYVTASGEKDVPVMIHRAVLGSLERMIGVLTEHTAGKWPLWLSPRQVLVLPLTHDQHEAAQRVHDALSGEFQVELASADVSLNKRIRTGEIQQWNYIVLLGQREVSQWDSNDVMDAHVTVRTRGGQVVGQRKLGDLMQSLRNEVENYE